MDCAILGRDSVVVGFSGEWGPGINIIDGDQGKHHTVMKLLDDTVGAKVAVIGLAFHHHCRSMVRKCIVFYWVARTGYRPLAGLFSLSRGRGVGAGGELCSVNNLG